MPLIPFSDFEKLDIRLGTIVAVMDFPEARKPAYQLTIDFGPLGIKQSSAQLTQLYSKETLLNRQIIAVVNLEPRKIAHFSSACLVLGVLDAAGTVTLLQPDKSVANGSKIA